jgi:flavin-dependent dehydrogenase
MTLDALVIGAGPAGSTAAILLARAGWRVAIAEKSRFPRRKVCGEYISAAAWPLLDELGVAEAIAAGAGPAVTRVGFYSGNDALSVRMPSAQGRFGRAIGREHLDTLLLARARKCGVEVREETAVRSLERREARIVVAAHGAWESGTLPTQAPHESAGARDLLGFKAHFRGARLEPGLMPLIVFPGGYGGLVHTDDGRVSLSCCVRREALAAARARYGSARAGEALLAHIVASNRGVREALEGVPVDGAWLSAGPIRP